MLIWPRLRSQIACRIRRSDRTARPIGGWRDAPINLEADRLPKFAQFDSRREGDPRATSSLLEVQRIRRVVGGCGWKQGVAWMAEGIVRHRRFSRVGVLTNDGRTLQMRHEDGVGLARRTEPAGRALCNAVGGGRSERPWPSAFEGAQRRGRVGVADAVAQLRIRSRAGQRRR